jgi:branched-chain amino acid transport system permease protein
MAFLDWLMPGVVRRAQVALLVLVAGLAAAPFIVDGYILSLLVVCLLFALISQSWNVMLGFAGQLSLGHALYTGLGAYVAAGLYVNLDVNPWLGMLAGVVAAMAAGAIVGFLGFRFSIEGVYFALLTIAFAEFTRIAFSHLDWFQATSGLFVPVPPGGGNDLLHLRGEPRLFYWLFLVATFATLALCHRLLRSRLGHYWLAIREDPVAAQTLGIDVLKYKMVAVMLSAGIAAVGGALYAFYYNVLFPDTAFALSFSIELTLATIVGGVGTLFGPILGAFILTPLGEGITALTEEWGLPGIKQFFYGICLVLIVVVRPIGLWPWICGRLGFGDGQGRGGGR